MNWLEIVAYVSFAIGVVYAIFVGLRTAKHFVTIKKEDASKTIRQPKAYLYVGLAGIVVMLLFVILLIFAPSIFSNTNEERWECSFFFMAIEVVFGLINIYSINWKVVVDSDCFYFTNMFGKQRRFGYDEVVVKDTGPACKVYKDRKYVLGISRLQDNCDALEDAKFLFDIRVKNNENSQ